MHTFSNLKWNINIFLNSNLCALRISVYPSRYFSCAITQSPEFTALIPSFGLRPAVLTWWKHSYSSRLLVGPAMCHWSYHLLHILGVRTRLINHFIEKLNTVIRQKSVRITHVRQETDQGNHLNQTQDVLITQITQWMGLFAILYIYHHNAFWSMSRMIAYFTYLHSWIKSIR